MKFAVIFAMGSDMGNYFCRMEALDGHIALAEAQKLYPERWVFIIPEDSRFAAHVKVYQKVEIPLGARLELVSPDARLIAP